MGINTAKIEVDGYADAIIGIAEKCFLSGRAWRMSTDIVTLSAGQYASINFITPSTGITFYQLSTIDKTGDELEVTLVEGGIYSDGSAISLWNFNRIVGDLTPPFIAKSGGTIVGGLEAPTRFIPGISQGNTKTGGSSEAPANIVLKPGTNYTLKITSIGEVKLCALLTIIYRMEM